MHVCVCACIQVLGSSFNPGEFANDGSGAIAHKLTDAITLHEIHDQAQEKASRIRSEVRTTHNTHTHTYCSLLLHAFGMARR